MNLLVGQYWDAAASYHEYDPQAPEVAAVVAEAIVAAEPRLTVEHIGSTALSGCAGKGIIDLMVLYPAGRLESAKKVLDFLGFQRQTTRDPFPEERPMRVGSILYKGKQFRLHAHVISEMSDEARELRAFRDRLRAEPDFRAAYEAWKRSILAAGVTDSVSYSEAKGEFIRRHLKAVASISGVAKWPTL
jgi:GrpB-like predicted nucleotidyltransferase (UPF0157 family)